MSTVGAAMERVAPMLPELYGVTTADEFPAKAMTLCGRLLGCDKVDYTEVDLAHGTISVFVWPEPVVLASLIEARKQFMPSHPVMHHYLRSPDPSTRQIADFTTRTEYHRSALYGEFFGPLGVEAQMTVLVSPINGRHGTGMSFDRETRDFDDHDRMVLDVLRPHLEAARDNATRFSQALAHGRPSATSDLRLERLTNRQLDILGRVAAGETNGQIATRLSLSPGTVRKHIEHILARLEVPSRTAAAVLYAAATPDVDRPPRWTATIELDRQPFLGGAPHS